MRFLIVNMYSFRNKGCEAFTKGVINGLLALDANAEFKIFSEDPRYDSLWLNRKQNVSFVHNPFGDWYSFSRWWHYRLVGALGISTRIREGLKAFKWADAVISTDDVFSSTYGLAFKCLAPIQTAQAFDKPVVLLGQSIGPFEKENEYRAFVRAMKEVRLITARESVTLEYVRDMKLEKTRIELTADPAFCLEPETGIVDDLWKTYNIPNEKTIIGIAPSQAISYFGRTSFADHFNTLKHLIESLLKQFQCHIVLLPHVEDTDTRNDDRILCEQLFRNLDLSENITVISLSHSAEEIRALISKLDIIMAERMHAAIAGLSEAVPTFVIGYSIKAKGILSDIFGSASIEDYMLPIADLSEEVLKNKVKNLLEKKSEVARHLSKVMPKVKENARRNFTLTLDILEQNTSKI